MRSLARTALALAGLLIIASLVVSFRITSATETAPARGGVYIEGLVGQPGRLSPLLAPANPCDRDLATLVFSGLTKRDEKGHIAPDLARRWELSTDARSYTFYLRADATWHDGHAVTAADVVYTVQALHNDDVPAAAWLRAFWKNVTAEKISDQVVRLTLSEPYAPFLQYTTLGLLPAHALASGGEAARESYDALPLGTGPYILVARTTQQAVLEAFPAYPLPMIPRLVFRYYPDRAAALTALTRGDVLAVADLNPAQARSLQTQQDISIHWAPRARQTAIIFNLTLPFFDDARVRRALLSAVDRQALVDSELDGNARLSDGVFLSTTWASRPASALAHSLDAAQALLDNAGWVDRDRDGVRERDGVKFEFGLLTNDDETRVAVATAIARSWTQVGAAVEVRVIGSQALLEDYLQPRGFEALLFGWDSSADDPDPYEMWHSSQRSGAGINFSGFASQRVDEILEQARRTADRATRKALYAQFQDVAAEQLPSFVLYEPQFALAVSGKLHAVRLSFIGEAGDRFRHIGEWYTLTSTTTVTETKRVR